MSSVYPHSCLTCSSPARKIGRVVLCSRIKCKSRRKVIHSFGRYDGAVIEIEEGLTKETAIKIFCPTCSAAAATGATAAPSAGLATYCYTCRHWFDYRYEVDHFYYDYARLYIYQFVGRDRGWWLYVGRSEAQ